MGGEEAVSGTRQGHSHARKNRDVRDKVAFLGGVRKPSHTHWGSPFDPVDAPESQVAGLCRDVLLLDCGLSGASAPEGGRRRRALAGSQWGAPLSATVQQPPGVLLWGQQLWPAGPEERAEYRTAR